MLTPENLSLILLLFLAAICIAGALLPFEIEVGEAQEEDEFYYETSADDQRFASRKAIQANSGAAITSEI